ncbi:unnamed protein product [Penicillium pancosmium]
MSEYNFPFTTSVAPYMNQHYVSSGPTPTMNGSSPSLMDINRTTYQAFPPSPSSSTGSNRVSKAKKGKRVHECEYPGCSKVFTRAEHRRRHELSHKNNKVYACTFEGCSKAFHRSDYLTQHLSRHDTRASVVRSPSSRCNSVSSPSQYPPGSPGSSAPTIFQSIEENIQVEPKSTPESSLAACSNCFGCQSGSGPCTNDQPMYSYSNTAQEALSSAPLISPQCVTSELPAGFETMIDQYMHSVLRPDAFLAYSQSIPPQSSGTLSPSYWLPNIDPQLPPLHSMVFENSTSYP